RVPPLLHTPLMSATNAMSGISLVGSLVVAGAGYGKLSTFFGFIAVSCSSTNVVGGFLITDRMLQMFRGERENSDRSGIFRYSMAALMALPIAFASLLALAASSSEGSGQYVLTQDSFEPLRNERVADSVLAKLRLLQDRPFTS